MYAYIRLNVSDTEVAGAGSQLDSLSAPGLACCMYISSEPSVLFFNPSVYCAYPVTIYWVVYKHMTCYYT